MSDCKVTNSLRNGCTPQHRWCTTLGDCPDHYTSVLAEYPAGTMIQNMTTGETYCDLTRLNELEEPTC